MSEYKRDGSNNIEVLGAESWRVVRFLPER